MELYSQLPHSRGLEAVGRGVGYPLINSQEHRCFVFQLMNPAEEKPVHAGEGCDGL